MELGAHPGAQPVPSLPIRRGCAGLAVQYTGLTHERFRQYMDARDRGELVVEHAGEREQVVALILQRHANRADASRIIRLAPLHLGGDKVEQVLSNLQARTGQRQNVVAQPCGERPDVAGKCMRACLGMAGSASRSAMSGSWRAFPL